MLKKCILISLFSCVFGLQAVQLKELSFIPAKSEVRTFCQKNQNNENCQTINRYLETISDSRFYKYEIENVDQKINELDQQAIEVQSANIPNFVNYIASKKAKLQANKFSFEQKRAAFPTKEEVHTAIDNILATIDKTKHEQEKRFLKEGFANVYLHNRPWNTCTTKEKAQIVLEWTAFGGLATLFGFMYYKGISNPNYYPVAN